MLTYPEAQMELILKLNLSVPSCLFTKLLTMDLLYFLPLVSLFLHHLIPKVSCVEMWDRATVVCETNGKKQIVEENSNRVVVLDSACQSGEVAWRLSETYVYLHFQKPSRFRVCFSSPAVPGYEKYSVYSMSSEKANYAGSPNRDGDICLTSSGTNLNLALQALNTYYLLTAKFSVSCVLS
ncbi:uncharacterized protein LOC125659459 [Ostrea edulis]|uniref:uncharacterized protein LOC125659459 n=1 Tax=Ostrea edulis TaxID=37623 RepID=UPI0024AF136E|nr:uncharacterized protein LOC125659459 [Ostrea edulis]